MTKIIDGGKIATDLAKELKKKSLDPEREGDHSGIGDDFGWRR